MATVWVNYWTCAAGHLILDEDLERTTFIVGTGVIGPMDIVSVVISTTLELPTLENGAIHIIYPTLLTPIVTGQMTSSKSENGSKSEETGYFNLQHFTFDSLGWKTLTDLCASPCQTHQLFRCHLRKTRPAAGFGAAVRPCHLHQSSCQPGSLWTQLPAVSQRGLSTGRYCLSSTNVLDSAIV